MTVARSVYLVLHCLHKPVRSSIQLPQWHSGLIVAVSAFLSGGCCFDPRPSHTREERANLSAFSYVCSVCACLDLSVSSSSWGLGRAAVCDCGTPLTFFKMVL